MICLLSHKTREWGFTGHSQRHGLEGSGEIDSSRVLVGRLCIVTNESLYFLTWVEKSHPLTLSWSLGPEYITDGLHCDHILQVEKSKITGKDKNVIVSGRNLAPIKQSLLRNKKYTGAWKVGERLAEYLPEL